jgi:translation initiation factor IF-3
VLQTLTRFFSKGPPQLLKNEQLARAFPTSRLIDNEGRLQQTLTETRSLLSQCGNGFDLVLVDGHQSPPIVRFQSHAESYKLAQVRADAETRARLANKLKEMQISTVVGEHDFEFKAARIKEWIEKGWRVKVRIEDRNGAQLAHRLRKNGLGIGAHIDPKTEMMQRVVGRVAKIAEVSSAPELERGCLLFSLRPNRQVLTALKQQAKPDNKAT